MKPSLSAIIALFLLFPLAGAHAQSWTFETQRAALAPAHGQDSSVRFEGRPTLSLEGAGKSHADGRWVRHLPVRGGAFYQFDTHFRPQSIEELHRSVLARVIWKDSDGKTIDQPVYPITLPGSDDDWRTIRGVYRAPEYARTATLELVYRWDADGRVHFSEASFTEVPPPAPRPASLAAVHYRPRNQLGLQANLEVFGKHITEAARQGADIVCLPEAVNQAATGRPYVDAAEPLPGPTSQYLSEVARRNRVYVVAGIIEKEGDIVYNTAVLIDRDGRIAGKYRKVSLPREEIDGGITPGSEYPVFETDFGTVGIMICWDVSFPEVARALARNGAEVILMPIWGGMIDLAEARAIENQVYLVSSTYDMKTGVFDREGKLVAEATAERPVTVWKTDLNERTMWPWLGDFGSRIPREMPAR